jgi:hypothetical protein
MQLRSIDHMAATCAAPPAPAEPDAGPHRALGALLVCVALAACGPPDHASDDDDDTGDIVDGGLADAGGADAMPEPFFGKVYAHSFFNLYAVNPDTFDVALIGPFIWPVEVGTDEMMTDIAVDHDGNIIGISYGAVYAVDHDTAACTLLAPLSGQEFNGLSFIPAGAIDPNSEEILVGTGLSGLLYKIDPATGASTEIGDYGGVIESSGDIVSVDGFGTVATVKNGSTNDYLARIDPVTGVATIIGTTGKPDIWGVGFWKGKVFGFVATNEFMLIDATTGVATYISTGPENWTGAGVTTSAPIIP